MKRKSNAVISVEQINIIKRLLLLSITRKLYLGRSIRKVYIPLYEGSDRVRVTIDAGPQVSFMINYHITTLNTVRLNCIHENGMIIMHMRLFNVYVCDVIYFLFIRPENHPPSQAAEIYYVFSQDCFQ